MFNQEKFDQVWPYLRVLALATRRQVDLGQGIEQQSAQPEHSNGRAFEAVRADRHLSR
jgi:hypothetical protein